MKRVTVKGSEWELELVGEGKEFANEWMHHPDDSTAWIYCPNGTLMVGLSPEIVGSNLDEDHGIAQFFTGNLENSEQLYDLEGAMYSFYKLTRHRGGKE